MANTYDKASLVLIPSGTKEGVIFSQKPTNGDGDFTFSRSTAATRVNADGLIEKERTNYVRYSQDFSQWSILGSATITTGVTDPNGGSTAATISNIGAGNLSDGIAIFNNPMTIGAGSVVSQSIYLKGSGTIVIAMERGVSGTYFFYQKTITLTPTWQRFDNFQQIGSAADGFHFYVSNYTGTTATSVDIAFAQFEFGTAPTEYIATTTSAVTTGITDNVPRLDYTDASCPSLLLEPQRTNLVPHSEYTGGYIAQGTGTRTDNDEISPEGLQNAFTLNDTSSGEYYRIEDTISVSGGDYTLSVFLKKTTGALSHYAGLQLDISRKYVIVDTTNGTHNEAGSSGNDSVTIEDWDSNWWRVIITNNIIAGTTRVALWPAISSDGSAISFGATGENTFYGIQLEESSYPTSYIPTYGTSVTRVADAASKTGISDLIGQTEGTLFLDFEFINPNKVVVLFTIHDNANNKRLELWANNNVLNGFIGGSVNIAIGNTTITNGRHKAAIAYDESGDQAFYVDGVQIGTSSTAYTIASLTGIRFNNWSGSGTYKTKEGVKQTLLFKTRLTNEELATLTTL